MTKLVTTSTISAKMDARVTADILKLATTAKEQGVYHSVAMEF